MRTTAIAKNCSLLAAFVWCGIRCGNLLRSVIWRFCILQRLKARHESIDAICGLLEAGEIAEGKLTADSVRTVLMAENMVPPPTQIAVADVVLASFDELLGSIAEVAAPVPDVR